MTSDTSVEVCVMHVWPACASSLCVVPCLSGPKASWFEFNWFNQKLIYTWDANWIQFISAEENRQRFSGGEMNLCLPRHAHVSLWAVCRLVLMLQRWKNETEAHVFWNVALTFFGSTKAMRRSFRCSPNVYCRNELMSTRDAGIQIRNKPP